MAQQPPHARPSDQIRDVKEKATDQFGKAAEQAGWIANRVAEQGREAVEHMQDVAGNMKGALNKSVKDRPMAMLAMAGIVGFVLGALWKS